MRKLMIFPLLLTLCCGTLAACQGTPSDPNTTDTQKTAMTDTQEMSTPEQTTEIESIDPATLSLTTYTLTQDTAHFKQHGRLILLADGLGCDHVMSGIEFEGIMYGEVKLTLSVTANTYFTVYIDGERVEQRLTATADTTELVIANFDTAELHNVRFVKQTEPQFSLCTLKSVTLTGELGDAPAQKPLYIEFLGDSITCGYGNLGTSSSEDPGNQVWHDGTQSFAAFTALALDADFSMIGCSGIGVNKGYPAFDMQQFYEKTSFFRDSTSEGSDHVFGRAPDAIVINLGTNDYPHGATEQEFKDSVKNLITFVRTAYDKDIPIVWVHNMMGECRFAWTEAVLEEMGGESAGIYSVRCNASHLGTNGHPNIAGHQNASKHLLKTLKELGLGE